MRRLFGAAFGGGLSVAFIAALTGCSVTPAGQDLLVPAETSDPPPISCGSSGGRPATEPAPSCARGETLYGDLYSCQVSSDACRFVGSRCGGGSYYCGKITARCAAAPTCDPGDRQVTRCSGDATCYTRSICGSTITCERREATCEAVPECDPGDTEVSGIDTCRKPGVSCYSRTVCNMTIWCVNEDVQ